MEETRETKVYNKINDLERTIREDKKVQKELKKGLLDLLRLAEINAHLGELDEANRVINSTALRFVAIREDFFGRLYDGINTVFSQHTRNL